MRNCLERRQEIWEKVIVVVENEGREVDCSRGPITEAISHMLQNMLKDLNLPNSTDGVPWR